MRGDDIDNDNDDAVLVVTMDQNDHDLKITGWVSSG